MKMDVDDVSDIHARVIHDENFGWLLCDGESEEKGSKLGCHVHLSDFETIKENNQDNIKHPSFGYELINGMVFGIN